MATARSRPDRSPEGRILRPALELALEVARAGLAEEPPMPPPHALRRVLSFARPSETTWATVRRVVDADESFRARVADAADPDTIGRGPWIWLSRPEGWEVELADLVDRAAAPSVRPEAESGEVAALRRKLAGAEQAARRHEEAADAAAGWGGRRSCSPRRAAAPDRRARAARRRPRRRARCCRRRATRGGPQPEGGGGRPGVDPQ